MDNNNLKTSGYEMPETRFELDKGLAEVLSKVVAASKTKNGSMRDQLQEYAGKRG